MVSADTNWTLLGDNSATGTINIAMPITSLQVTGTTTLTIPVKLLVTNGSLSMATTTGLTFTGGTTGSVLYFSGSYTDINNALASLRYTRGSAGSDTLEVSLVNPGEVFFADNNHLYEYISSTLTWGAAKTAAEALTKYGATGYLTTITSQAENDFVAARLSNAGWMGASDSVSEGVWRWVTGPENGTQFWSGNYPGGTSFNGAYGNWNNMEPNDSGANEDCGQFLSGSNGKWNDLPCSGTTLPGYVVEYGGNSTSSLPTVTAKNISIVTQGAPTINTITPNDNAVNISTSTNLTISFSKAVIAGSGNIYIKKMSDNSIVETISATSSLISGTTTDTIIINPYNDLSNNTSYYVTIDSGVFTDIYSNAFTGISASSTWNFTTIKTPKDIALDKIQAYATSNGTTTTPTMGDYADAEVVGVDNTNIDMANSSVSAVDAVDVDTTLEIQNLLTPILSLYKIKTYANTANRDNPPQLSDYQNISIAGLSNNNISEFNRYMILNNLNIVNNSDDIQLIVNNFLNTKIVRIMPGSSLSTGNKMISVVPSVPSSVSYDRYLKVGSMGNDVFNLQKFLNNNGYTISKSGPGSPGNETDKFGSLTKKALMNFQKKNGIPATGYFGQLTKIKVGNR